MCDVAVLASDETFGRLASCCVGAVAVREDPTTRPTLGARRGGFEISSVRPGVSGDLPLAAWG